MDGDVSVGHRVADRRELKHFSGGGLAGVNEFFPRQLCRASQVTIRGSCGEMPKIRDERGDVVGLILFVFLCGRGEEKSFAVRVHEDEACQRDVHGFALFPHFGQRFRDSQFACFAVGRDRTEKALRRARRADYRAQLHHRLIPVAWGGGRQQPAGFELQCLPFLPFAQISADCFEPRKDARHVAIQDRGALIEGDTGNCRRGVIADSGERKNFLARFGEDAAKFSDDLARSVL